MIIVDIYENTTYDVQNELKVRFPELDLVVLIASVRNTNRMNWIFEHYKPEIIYHAAAHKHVPLMEESPNEAIKNNVLGTWKIVQAADRYGVKKFVMISTDKAVNPTNIMGASKRICEMIIQTYNRRSKTDFVAVRFGNVLGSNGSVIPLFKNRLSVDTGHGYPSGYRAVFYDNSGSGITGAAGGHLCQRWRNFCSGYGRASQDSGSGKEPDSSFRSQAG